MWVKDLVKYRGFSAISARHFSNRFITLPIFYANADPHLGHLYTALLGDAIHRWELLKINSNTLNTQWNQAKDNCVFSAGTDEHGSKIELAAKNANLSSLNHSNLISSRFQHLFKYFNISNTTFIRTTDERHKEAVEHFWNALAEKGLIKKASYKGWYSLVDECFYRESDTEICEASGQKRVAKESRSLVEFVEEENYIFPFEEFQDDVRDWLIESDVILPKQFLPIALQYLRRDGGLSISRDASRQKWGIAVPGDPSQTIYVWLDALVNYLTVAGYPHTKARTNFLWPPDLQIIGKDILRFHAIYWPAFLMAAGLPLPKRIFVHSHWLVDRQKMSKSIGNVVDPLEISQLLTVDGIRYFLLKQGVPHDDANFTLLKAITVINSDLVNNLGNLLNRATTKRLNPTQRYPAFDVEVMEHELKGTGEKLVLELKTLLERVGNHYEGLMFHKGLETINETLNHANAFFQLHEPWNMSKGPELSTVLFLAYETCRICSLLLQPIIPTYSAHALSRLGINASERTLGTAQFAGGPTIKIYCRPLGIDNGPFMHRIDKELMTNGSSVHHHHHTHIDSKRALQK